MNQPRVQPLNPPYGADTQAAFDRIMPPGMAPLKLFRSMAHNPRVLQRMLAGGLLDRGSIALRERELLILRATALCGAEYEWGIHIALLAAKAGLTDAQVRSLTTGSPTDPCWTDPADRAVLAAVDGLHARHDLTDDEWDALTAAVGPDGVVDLMLICGWYHAISYVARAARLPAEPGTPTFESLKRR